MLSSEAASLCDDTAARKASDACSSSLLFVSGWFIKSNEESEGFVVTLEVCQFFPAAGELFMRCSYAVFDLRIGDPHWSIRKTSVSTRLGVPSEHTEQGETPRPKSAPAWPESSSKFCVFGPFLIPRLFLFPPRCCRIESQQGGSSSHCLF